jgi:hypothetical protein
MLVYLSGPTTLSVVGADDNQPLTPIIDLGQGG